MRQLKIIFLNILLFTVLSVGGMVAGYKVGHTIDFPSSESTPWVLLDSPVKFSQITDINYDGIWAQTTNGKLYLWEFWCYKAPETCKQWIETENIPSDAHKSGGRLNKGKSCPESFESPKRIPEKVIECAHINFQGGTGHKYIALLEDGTIWEWFPPVGTDYPIGSFLIGPATGLVLGIIADVILIVFQYKRKKQLSTQA